MSTHLVDLSASPDLTIVAGGRGEQRHWFAVFTRSHHEKRVAQYYAEREIEHLLPISRMVRQWSHYRKVTVEMPLFPNYIFAHILRGERTAALKVPGAVSLVSQSGVPAALPDEEIESLREGLKLRNATPHPYLVAGARVRINKGALAGREGIVLRHKNGFRVVLTLSVVMRSFAVEVDAADVEYLAG
jgi:transcription antitermination factor NusG